MQLQTMDRLEAELKQGYAGATSTGDAGRRLVRLPEVSLPIGCRPETTRALVVIDPAADKPELYLRDIPTLPTGIKPSTGQVVIAGETWNTYSYALRNWEAETNTAEQFVQGKLRRFSLGA